MQPTVISISSSSTWCSVNYMPTHNKKADRKKWLKGKELYLAHTNVGSRVVTPVTVKNTDKESQKIVFLMDAVTGSLYDCASGECLTSSHVRIEDFEFRKGLEKILLEIKSQSEV
jgi:hypothetical protein